MVNLKASLRQAFLTQRQALANYQELSTRLCFHLRSFLECEVPSGQTVLAYWPFRQEPDLDNLWQGADYQWGLPRCLPQQQLAWHQWCWGEPLATNRHGLAEPLAIAPRIEPAQVQALILPAVAIDHQGYRLGYGGGYFDRLLAQPAWQEVLTIGVVFDFAYVAALPIDPWDRPLVVICTESGIKLIDNCGSAQRSRDNDLRSARFG